MFHVKQKSGGKREAWRKKEENASRLRTNNTGQENRFPSFTAHRELFPHVSTSFRFKLTAV